MERNSENITPNNQNSSQMNNNAKSMFKTTNFIKTSILSQARKSIKLDDSDEF